MIKSTVEEYRRCAHRSQVLIFPFMLFGLFTFNYDVIVMVLLFLQLLQYWYYDAKKVLWRVTSCVCIWQFLILNQICFSSQNSIKFKIKTQVSIMPEPSETSHTVAELHHAVLTGDVTKTKSLLKYAKQNNLLKKKQQRSNGKYVPKPSKLV